MSGFEVHTTIVEQLTGGNTVTYFTRGVSMRPLLRERQTHVTIAPLGDIHDNDILLYIRANGDLVLHRLIKQDGDTLYMRGDNTYGLEPIDRAQAVGVVTHIYRNGRTFAVDCNRKYTCYVVFWRAIYPLRRLAQGLRSVIRRMFR